jgi:mRNA interferase RelE/StbE
MASPLYGLAYSTEALAFLKTLVPKHRRQIAAKIGTLATEPYPPNSKLVKGMGSAEEPVRRIRSGDYRILYIVKENPEHIAVIDIGHRKDVYR